MINVAQAETLKYVEAVKNRNRLATETTNRKEEQVFFYLAILL